MIFHNYNICTSLFQYARTHTYTTINTKDRNVNEQATLGGMFFFLPITLFLMTTDTLLTELPFRDVAEITTLDNERSNIVNYLNNHMSTNNDGLMELDPDHNTLENYSVKKCSNYDTSLEFNKSFCSQNNIYILHLHICSSQHKLTDLTCYLENLNIKFSFIGIGETWAT